MASNKTLQDIITKFDERINDLGKSAERSRKQKDHYWEILCNAQVLGLLIARRIVLDAEEGKVGDAVTTDE